jgi:hypothetical protein
MTHREEDTPELFAEPSGDLNPTPETTSSEDESTIANAASAAMRMFNIVQAMEPTPYEKMTPAEIDEAMSAREKPRAETGYGDKKAERLERLGFRLSEYIYAADRHSDLQEDRVKSKLQIGMAAISQMAMMDCRDISDYVDLLAPREQSADGEVVQVKLTDVQKDHLGRLYSSLALLNSAFRNGPEFPRDSRNQSCLWEKPMSMAAALKGVNTAYEITTLLNPPTVGPVHEFMEKFRKEVADRVVPPIPRGASGDQKRGYNKRIENWEKKAWQEWESLPHLHKNIPLAEPATVTELFNRGTTR